METILISKLQALSDSMWKAMADHMKDIERIAKGGFNSSERDRDIVQMVFSMVAGDLCLAKLKEV